MAAHALLSASKAEQWINCPPSIRLQESVPDKTSEYAERGTVAHELAEIKLRSSLYVNKAKDLKALEDRLAALKTNEYYDQEMESNVQVYVEFVQEKFMEAKARSADAVLLLEERLDFSRWVPEGFGTGDTILISDGVLEVIDLKFGTGVPVDAINNPQIRLYALGAIEEYAYLYDIAEVRMTIVQPRLDKISTEIMSVEDLLTWAEAEVKPAAEQAFAGKGAFKCGDHCRWCRVKGNCRTRADENLKALEYEFTDPALLSDEEIGSILFITEPLKTWANDVKAYAEDRALHGYPIPQHKLVEGKSYRKWTNESAVIKCFEAINMETDKYLKPQELLGFTELDKRIGKKQLNDLVGSLITKTPGKPTLVPETDNRPVYNSLETEFADIDLEVE